jgi:hypothetical protein
MRGLAPPRKIHYASEQDRETACGRSLEGPVTRLPEITLIISGVTCERCRNALRRAADILEGGAR